MDFSGELIKWYEQNKRDLPWRHTTDAYVIWLSEIILQQTRVEQGLPYFIRFLDKYADVTDFAAADENDILKLWQGLGYYSRGRNMLATARLVNEMYHGKFPTQYDELIKLKGVGEYTAAAIASFSSNEPKAVVDGNVYRVLSRYFGIAEPINSTQGKKLFQQLADQSLNRSYPALHNQAIMEFGAMLCKPKNPACGVCPVRLNCNAFLHKATATLPVKINKVKIRDRFFNYFLIRDEDNVLMNKRADTDIWANMYDLPLIETTRLCSFEELKAMPEVENLFGEHNIIKEISSPAKHLLTHQRLHVRFIVLKHQPLVYQTGWISTSIKDLESLPMPKIIFIFIKNIFNL